MTNEKAIALINDAFGGYYSEWAGTFTEAEKDELAEANRMAIAALEQAPAIPLDWIRSYIETCNLFDLRINVSASKVISVMIKTWEQENPGAKRGEADGNN